MAKVVGTSVSVVKEKEKPTCGGWLSVPQARKRKGITPNGGLYATDSKFLSETRPDRFLSDGELWNVYRRTADVRSCVDSIVRRVATFDWTIRPTVEPQSEYYLDAVEIAKRAQRFLSAPNKNGDTWQDIMTAVLTDLLVYDAGAIELARDSRGKLQELVPLRGCTIRPVLNKHGRLIEYTQDTTLGGVDSLSGESIKLTDQPRFKPQELVYFQLFPNTANSGYGNPLIEAIVNEIIILLRSSEHLMMAYDADEIPPGILVLAGIAGNAAREARADFQNLKGQDSKIRVLTTPDPSGAGAKWVELQRTPKDLEFETLVEQVRRVVWRVFGVMPVEMGASDEMPRATAQVQIDVSSSHLVTPMLEMLQAKINTRILPLVVGDSELSQLVKFEFDRGMRPSAEEAQLLAQKYQRLVGIGVMTRNEVRKEMGLLPIFNGDIPTVDTAQGPLPLDVLIVEGPVGGLVIEPPDVVPDAGVVSPGPINDEEVPGEVVTKDSFERAAAHDCDGRSCEHHSHEFTRSISSKYLPSDWQSEGRFKDYRTLNLNSLGWATINYTKSVTPFWVEARDSAMAVIGSYYKNGSINPDSAPLVQQELAKIIDKLGTQWSIVTRPLYREAADVAKASVYKYTGQEPFSDWNQRADIYGEEAMFYLTNPEGMLGVIKTELMLMVDAFTRGVDLSEIETRTDPKQPKVTAPKDAKPGIEAKSAVGITAKVFDSNEHRIGNWSGKLVALANQLLQDGVIGSSTSVDEEGRVEWFYEWVMVGDARTCTTCIIEGSSGFRPVSTMSVQPGAGTICGARCRCVIVLWTKTEIDRGVAERLSPNE